MGGTSGLEDGADDAVLSRVLIRAEAPGDLAAIRAVHVASFPTDAEARLVDALRRAGRVSVSLVAVRPIGEAELPALVRVESPVDAIVGHIAFSPVAFVPDDPASLGSFVPPGMGLAPVAVLAACRRQGIGAALVGAGIEACRRAGCSWVVVLGAPDSYSRFGFRSARERRLRDEYADGDAFQILNLDERGVPEGPGVVQYAKEFTVLAE